MAQKDFPASFSSLITDLKISNEFDKLKEQQELDNLTDLFFHSLMLKVTKMESNEVLSYLINNFFSSLQNDKSFLDLQSLISQLIVLLLSNCLIMKFELITFFDYVHHNCKVEQLRILYSNVSSASNRMCMNDKLYNYITDQIITINQGLQESKKQLAYTDILSHITLMMSSADDQNILIASKICSMRGFLDTLSTDKCPLQYYLNHLLVSFLLNSCFNSKLINYESYLSNISKLDVENVFEDFSLLMVTKLHHLFLVFFKTSYRTAILRFFLEFIQSLDMIVGIGYSFEPDCMPSAMLINSMLVFNRFCSKIKLPMVQKKFLTSRQFIIATQKHTRMLSSESELLEKIEKQVDLSDIDGDDFNFSTYIFFLTSSFQNLSIVPLINKQKNMQRSIEEMNPIIERAEELNNQATRALGLSDNFLGTFNRQFEGILNDYERRKAVCKYTELIQSNSVILSASFQYYELASKFILNLIEEHEELTQNSAIESHWSFLPESFIENIEISLLSISKLRHENLYVGDISELFHLSYKIICAYCTIHLIRNKHLIAKIIYALLHIMSSRNKSFLSFLLSQCENYEFIISMIYIFNEFTSDNDSDKFTLRLSINDYFKNLKLLPSYSYLNNLSVVADKYYMKYINTILDDLSYTLNEGLNTLKKIRQHQLTHSGLGSQNASNDLLNTSPASTDRNQGDISSNLTEEERAQNHVRNEQSINSLLLLSVSNLETLKDLTLHSQDEFLKDEILMRLVPMLNYNIGILCGENSMQFKVKNSQKYNWNPRKLLGLIIDVFLNMRHKIFYQSLAADNTTSLKAYKKAYNVMIKNLKKTVEECNQFKIFIFSLEQHITESKETNEMLEDAPEEFLDPLTYVLMKDPVKLPSGVIMERTVIIQHLLTQNTDPFTRQELKESELVEDVDLKNRIEMWLKSKMRR